VEQKKIVGVIVFSFIIALMLPLPYLLAENEYTVCLFKINDLSSNQANLKYESIIQEILSTELENAGYKLNDQSAAASEQFALISGPAVLETAQELGAQLALTGFYYIENERITLDLKCYDVEQKKLISSNLRSGSPGLSIYNLVNQLLQSMLIEMKARYFVKAAKNQKPADSNNTTSENETIFIEHLTLRSDLDGMQILLPGKVLLGEMTDGELETDLPFPIHSQLIIEKQKDGYHSQREKLSIKKEVQESYILPINKKNHYALEFNSTAGQLLGLGLGFRYYLNPDYFFISAEDYFFVQHTLHADDKPVFHNDIKLLTGHYLWGANAIFRIAISAGVGDIVTFFSVDGLKPKNDVYLNVLNIHFELNFSDWSFYLREELKYALGIGDNALGRNWLFITDGLPILTVGILGKW
jgi:hypothetical protein